MHPDMELRAAARTPTPRQNRRPPGTSLDGRSREYRLLTKTKRDLTASVGGSPSAVQTLLTNQAANLTVRLWQADSNVSPGEMISEAGTKHYVSLANALTRVLLRLGKDTGKALAKPTSTLKDIIARHASRADAVP